MVEILIVVSLFGFGTILLLSRLQREMDRVDKLHRNQVERNQAEQELLAIRRFINAKNK